MIFNRLKSNKGSTLLMVLVTLTVLSILGTALISAAVVNYKVKIQDSKSKMSLYIAEAGLEEVYAKTCEKIQEGIEKSKVKANDELQDEINNEKAAFNDPNQVCSGNYLITDPSDKTQYGKIDEKKVKSGLNSLFKKHYQKFFNDEYEVSEDNADLEDFLQNVNAYGSVNGKTVKRVQVVGTKDFREGSNPDVYQITLESEYSGTNEVTKVVQTTFSIHIPDYDQPYYVNNEVLSLKKNILWSKAITAEGNMVIRGKDVEIDGDVYVYGDPLHPEQTGIMTQADGSGLSMNGVVSTGGYIRTIGNNSSITIDVNPFIKNRELKDQGTYCNSLVVPEGTSGSTIHVKTDLNTYDDVEMDGASSTIEVDGNYFGFNSGDTHATSSSVVINSDDIGKAGGSNVKLLGDGGEIFYDLGDASVNTMIASGVYIGGTVYIDLGDENTYQTGESVSIKGNYSAYSNILKNAPESKYNNLILQSFPPLELVERFADGSKMLVDDLSKYFLYNYRYEPNGHDNINLGYNAEDLTKGLYIQNVKFSTGANIVRDNGIPEIKPTIIDISYKTGLNYRAKDYLHNIYKMSDEQAVQKDESFYTSIDEDSLKAPLSVSDRFNFKEDINRIDEDEVSYVNTEPGYDTWIVGQNGKGGDTASDTYSSGINTKLSSIASNHKIDLSGVDNGTSKGIIVSKGDIYISGQIDFTGTIITEGNIYFLDDYPKKIKNDYDESNITCNNYVIRRVYEDLKDTGIQIGDLFVQNPEWEEKIEGVIESDAGVDTSDKTYYKTYPSLVTLSSWKKTR